MRISDWSSDVCSSDLDIVVPDPFEVHQVVVHRAVPGIVDQIVDHQHLCPALHQRRALDIMPPDVAIEDEAGGVVVAELALAVISLRRACDGVPPDGGRSGEGGGGAAWGGTGSSG